jgi:hypothetical protein
MESSAVTFRYRVDNYAVVQLLTNLDVSVGDTVDISGVGDGFDDAAALVVALPPYQYIGTNTAGQLQYNNKFPMALQVLYPNSGPNVILGAVNPFGLLEWDNSCTWVDGNDVAAWLNILYASDSAFLDQCAAAANEFCWRRRQEAGYTDSLTTVPNGSVYMGTVQMGGAIYRQRGSIDQFASFNEFGAVASTVGLSPIIKQLLGVPRPALA